MAKTEATNRAKELATALNEARFNKETRKMNNIRKQVKEGGLIWEVNQLSSRIIQKHIQNFLREIRGAAQAKDIEKINQLSPYCKKLTDFAKLALTSLKASTKEKPGDIVY